MYRAVIFDFFGVIHDDPLKLWLESVNPNKLASIVNVTRDFDTGCLSFAEYLKELANVSGHTVEYITRQFKKATINPDVRDLIKALLGKTHICLLSNAGLDELDRIMQIHDLHSLFDTIIVSSQVGLAKPDKVIFEHTLAKVGVNAHEAIFIDDNPVNVQAAENLGIKSVLFEGVENIRSLLLAENLIEEVEGA